MTIRLPWLLHYERGLSYMRSGDVTGAVREFDEVSSVAAQMYRELGSPPEVLGTQAEDLARLERLMPARWRHRWEDRLLSLLVQLSPLLKTRIVVPAKVVNGFSTTSTSLQIAETFLVSFKRKRNLVDYLPAEILTMIGRLVVDDRGSSDVALGLASVSRRWKSILESDSLMWGFVVLDGQTQEVAIAKANNYMSRGPMRRLDIAYGTTESTDDLFKVLRSRLRGLLHLQILVLQSPKVPLAPALEFARRCPALETLVIYLSDASIFFTEGTSKPELGPVLPQIRHLALLPGAGLPAEDGPLSLLSPALLLMPNLESLVIDHPACTVSVSLLGSEPVHLPHLRQLSVTNSDVWDPSVPSSLQSVFILPQLRGLDLSGSADESYIPYLFPLSRPPNTQHLTHLILHDSNFDQQTLLGHLPSLPILTHLDIRTHGRIAELGTALCSVDENHQPKLVPRLEELHITEEDRTAWASRALVVRLAGIRKSVPLRVTSWRSDGTDGWVYPLPA